MSKVIEVLEKARQYVEAGWTQGQFAKDENGATLALGDFSRATCHCLVGAVVHAELDLGLFHTGSDDTDRAVKDAIRQAIESRLVVNWNDTEGRTQQEVLTAFDRAIEIRKEYEQLTA